MPETIASKKFTDFAGDSAAKLLAVWAPLKKVLTFSAGDDRIMPSENLSVSIEKGGLSVAYGSRFLSRVSIQGTREYLLEEGKYPQPENLASSLALAAKDFGASATEITLGIPKAWTVIKVAEFPATVKEDLPAVVAYELDRLTPFSPDEAFFDFKVLKDNGERITLLLMAAKTDVITPYLDAFRENGFFVERITANLSGKGTLAHFMEKSENTIFLEIDQKGFETASFSHGCLTYASSGSFKSPEEKEKAEMIASEIRSLPGIAGNYGSSTRVTLLLKDKSATLRELLKTKVPTPFRLLEEGDMRLRFPGLGREIPYNALGTAVESLWLKSCSLNLLKKGIHEKQKTPVGLTVILLLAILAMAVLYIIEPLSVEKKRLKDLSALISSKKEEARSVETLKKNAEEIRSEIAVINNFKEGRAMTLNILKELTSILPKTTWLSRVRVTDTSVEIEGYAGSATEVLPKLEASKYFRKVEFSSPTFRDPRMNSDKFSIRMEIETVRKDTVALTKAEEKTQGEKK